MSKLLVALLMVIVSASSASAQSDYMLDYGPGSISWTWQQQQGLNAMSMQNAMMQQQIANYYRQQAAAANQWMQTNPFTPMPGVVTYDGIYVTPETANQYHKEDVTCEHCNDGFNYRSVYLGNGQTRRVKSRCTWCHGKGYVTKTVKNR